MEGTFLKIIIIVAQVTKYSLCTIAGLSYMDPLNFKSLRNDPDADPCNPLYWYPKHLPEFCYIKTTPNNNNNKPEGDQQPLQMPIPVPVPHPIPVPDPVPFPPLPPVMQPPVAPPPPVPPMNPIPVPYGLPIAPSFPMMPVAGVPQTPFIYQQPYPSMPGAPYPIMPGAPYPSMPGAPYLNPYQPPRRQVGMVPGIPGIVSPDGGINILPFSDAYSDMLEKHKNKMLRKKLRRVILDYNDFPFGLRRHRKYNPAMSE